MPEQCFRLYISKKTVVGSGCVRWGEFGMAVDLLRFIFISSHATPRLHVGSSNGDGTGLSACICL